MSVRTRIAPSPTGFPHVGTIYQAIFNYLWARKHDGQFLVRLEDTDRKRFVPEAAVQILDMVRWSGIPYDEGPDVGGAKGPYVQSERLEIYQDHAQRLIASGNAYYCFCTPERLAAMRQEQEAKHVPPKYDRHCLRYAADEVTAKVNAGEPFVIRMRIPDGATTFVDRIRGEITFQHVDIDDQVLQKADGFPTYHLAVVVDDYLMGITDVIRGEEWISSTPKHVLLYGFFGWPLPTFAHLALLLNVDKSKLSKRKNDVSVLSYKEQGFLPEALVNFLTQQAWSHPESKDVYALDEAVQLFSWDRVQKTGSIFSTEKMRWYNGQYIRALDPEDLTLRLRDYSQHTESAIRKAVPLIQDRLVTLAEFDSLVAFLFAELPYEAELLVPKGKDMAETRAVVNQAIGVLGGLAWPWTQEAWEAALRGLAEVVGWKAGELFMTLRVAVTFAKQSPPLLESMVLLGEVKTMERLGAAADGLSGYDQQEAA